MCTAQIKCVLPAEGSGSCVQGAGWGCCQQAPHACGASTKPSSQGTAPGDIEPGVMAVAICSMCSSSSAPFSSLLVSSQAAITTPVVPWVLCPPVIPVRTSQPRGCPAPSCVLGCFLGKKVAETAPGRGASRRAEQPRCVCLLCWSLRSRVPSTLPSGRIRRKWPPLLQYRSLGFL